MYICVCVHVYVCIYICMHMNVCIWIHIFVCVWSVCMHACMYVCMYVCMWSFDSFLDSTRLYMYMYVHVYLCMCIYSSKDAFMHHVYICIHDASVYKQTTNIHTYTKPRINLNTSLCCTETHTCTCIHIHACMHTYIHT